MGVGCVFKRIWTLFMDAFQLYLQTHSKRYMHISTVFVGVFQLVFMGAFDCVICAFVGWSVIFTLRLKALGPKITNQLSFGLCLKTILTVLERRVCLLVWAIRVIVTDLARQPYWVLIWTVCTYFFCHVFMLSAISIFADDSIQIMPCNRNDEHAEVN